MKKMILAALAMAVTLPAATSTYAQYDDDIYFSSSSAERYEPVKETVMEEWSTNANNDWDIDTYNRRTSDVASYTASSDTYAQSVSDNPNQNFSFGTEPGTDYDNVIHDTVYVIENYCYTDRIRRFHNPWCSYHIWNPYWDVAYWDPFYWDYCYWDPWWYVTPSFGFHYGSWYWGWNYGYYTGWYGGWYSPFYRPYPHYYGPYYGGGGHHGWHSRPNQGSRTNNMGGSFASRGSRNGTSRPGNRQYTSDARRSGISGGNVSRSHSGATTARATRNSNMKLPGDQISRSSNTRSEGRNLTSGGTTVRGNRGTSSSSASSTRSMTGSSARSVNNSNARRQANGVRQNSSGVTYRSTQRAASSSNSFNRSTTSRSSGSYNRSSSSSNSYNNSNSNNSNSSTTTRSYTPSSSSSSSGYSGGSFGGRSGGSSGSFGGRSGGGSGSFGGRSGGSSGGGGRSGGGRR